MKRIINLIVIIAIAALVVGQDKKTSKKKGQEADSTKVVLEQLKNDYQKQNAKMDSILIEKAK